MKHLDDLLAGGPAEAARKLAYKAELLKIEEKHAAYFQDRPARYAHERHERLHNHFISTNLFYDRQTETLVPGSDLPQDIIDECRAAFDRVWNS